MKTLLLVFLTTCANMIWCQMNYVWRPDYYYKMGRYNYNASHIVRNLTSDVIKDTDERIRAIENIRLENFRTAAFEIGFLNYVIMEEYRKMLDKYNVTVSMGGQLYALESLFYLIQIELHYWHIDNLVNMQHEIERKYRIKSSLIATASKATAAPVTVGMLDFEPPTTTQEPNLHLIKVKPTKDRKKQQEQALMDRLHSTRKRSTRWWWPIEYGWEIEYYW